MQNGYLIIILLFLIGGLATCAWGWTIMARGRRMQRWPNVEGIIEVVQPASSRGDLLPRITYRYSVDGKSFESVHSYPSGTAASPELADFYNRKYPQGSTVRVWYDPLEPRNSVLEPGPQQGDWLVLAFGAGAVLISIAMLIL